MPPIKLPQENEYNAQLLWMLVRNRVTALDYARKHDQAAILHELEPMLRKAIDEWHAHCEAMVKPPRG
jgi:hypothetical protein